MQFFKMQLLWAALPGDIRKVVTQHEQNSITQVANTMQREARSKISKTVATLDKEKQLLHR